ncbi:hypothetical protein VII00023_08219 [Vibrio ichthyoenteri ATCC 700023]|uniref:Uncharacterized protein n=2 Tax=Vibrio ichthyoenteri TaxID=142461 RepID=F9S045_9VIBR|nr:hypothetical protein VII00023_08219 [Vibrio ichthyoenteri ATCC 700023]
MSFDCEDEIDGFKFKKFNLDIKTPLGGNGKFHVSKDNKDINFTLGAGALGFGAEITVGLEKEEAQRVKRPPLLRQSDIDKTGIPRVFIRT